MIVGDLANEESLLKALNIPSTRASSRSTVDSTVTIVDSQEMPIAMPQAVSRTLSTAGRTVLLVEDDESLRSLGREVLGHQGHKVLPVKDGEEALAVYRQHENEIGLMMTDVTMPAMSGFELAKQVRRIRPEIKLLFVSGYTGDDERLRDFPDAHFLAKPFQLSEMVGAVEELLVADDTPLRAQEP